VSGNRAGNDGGGIWSGNSTGGTYGGAFTIADAEVTANSCNGNGGGIYAADSQEVITVGGATVVAGNTGGAAANNAYLDLGAYLAIGDGNNGAPAPAPAMLIGATKTTGERVIVAAGASASDTQYYLSDNPALAVIYSGGQLKLAPLPASGISIDPAALPLAVGASAPLVALDASASDITQSVAWSSNDESIATVDADGVVTAIAAGTATVTATSADGQDMAA